MKTRQVIYRIVMLGLILFGLMHLNAPLAKACNTCDTASCEHSCQLENCLGYCASICGTFCETYCGTYCCLSCRCVECR